jgi:hypothetical protein
MPAANGGTDFSVLQNELKGRSTKIVMVAFDLLYLNGYDLRKLQLVERKAQLIGMRIASQTPSKTKRYGNYSLDPVVRTFATRDGRPRLSVTLS